MPFSKNVSGNAERHPLDQDDDDMVFGSPESSAVPQTNRSLQKFSIYLLIVTAVLVVGSGIIAANSAPTSPAGNLAYGLNRLFMFVLLLGFGLLLIAYRWNSTQDWLVGSMPNNSPYPGTAPSILDTFSGAPGFGKPNELAPRSYGSPAGYTPNFSATPSIPSANPTWNQPAHATWNPATNTPASPPPESTSPPTSPPPAANVRSEQAVESALTLSGLYALNAAIAVGIVTLLFLVPDFLVPVLIVPLSAMLGLSLGLSVTMAVWHTGILRAYAIGLATGILLFGIQGMGTIALTMFGGGWGLFGGGGSNRWNIGLPFAIAVALIMTSGLISATYVHLLTAFRKQQNSRYR